MTRGLTHAQRILAEVDQMSADLTDHAKGLIGRARPWASTSAIIQLLPGGSARGTPAFADRLNRFG